MTWPMLPGLEIDRLRPWLASHVPELKENLSAELIAGGKSNLTYVVSDGQRRCVLRRPPLGHVLATAHDMGREFRVMSALQGTDVPVPVTRAMCDDVDVLGAPFYIMDFVDGKPYRSAAELSHLGEARTRAISRRLVDTLADLHAIKPADVGLDGFGRPAQFLARQVQRWRRQLESSYTRPLPTAEELYDWLADNVPPDGPPGIVHGDFRLDNVLIDAEDSAVAIVDWEMSTIGDSLTDLALMVVYSFLAERLPHIAVADAAAAPGFLTPREIVDRYAERSGRDLTGFGFYLGLASFKLAVITEGIHYRFTHGQTVGDGFERVGEAVEPLLEFGLASICSKV